VPAATQPPPLTVPVPAEGEPLLEPPPPCPVEPLLCSVEVVGGVEGCVLDTAGVLLLVEGLTYPPVLAPLCG
jgi:hypothetical protein